ncbi:MAG: hypothetical protein OXC68_03705 [Aestuariivita sp.]|nr:hypothetical protein [Aestuariivita sp.]
MSARTVSRVPVSHPSACKAVHSTSVSSRDRGLPGIKGEILDRHRAQTGLRIKGLSHQVPPVFSLGVFETLILAKICGFRANRVC